MMARYITRLVVTDEHEYEIDARTSEEAETIAEQMYADGEEGVITSSTVEAWDTFPSEGIAEDAN